PWRESRVLMLVLRAVTDADGPERRSAAIAAVESEIQGDRACRWGRTCDANDPKAQLLQPTLDGSFAAGKLRRAQGSMDGVGIAMSSPRDGLGVVPPSLDLQIVLSGWVEPVPVEELRPTQPIELGDRG